MWWTDRPAANLCGKLRVAFSHFFIDQGQIVTSDRVLQTAGYLKIYNNQENSVIEKNQSPALNMVKAFAIAFFLLVSVPYIANADEDGPSKLELSGAEHRLVKLEKQVQRAHGQPFKLNFEGREALERIKKLNDKYPHDTKVKELFKRARVALLASKGEVMQITPQMLAYRENEKLMTQRFFDIAKTQWDDYQKTLQQDKKSIIKTFPAPSHKEVGLDQLKGRHVVLDDFIYPTNMFRSFGRQMLFVGSDIKGYYFADLSSSSWLGTYEAVKRYRRLINQDVPEGMKWTVVGKITGLERLIPQAGKKKTKSPQWGWRVEPVAIYVPDRTFTVADKQLENGGTFAGEKQMEAIKSAQYTITKIPDDVTPERLVKIYATAIKEKNYPLFLDCIDPKWRQTPTALGRIMYHWDLHQHRFATFYVHVEVQEAYIMVIKGFDAGDDLESAFLTKEEQQDIKKTSEPLVEQAELKTVAYDERGRQYGSPKPRFLKRKEKGRWYITNYPQPF